MLKRVLAAILFASAGSLLTIHEACAVMGTPTIMSRVDKNGDGTLSIDEVRAAAAKRYDLIKSRNGGRVTMLQLGGRVTADDLKKVGLPPGPDTVITKDNYLALAGKLFDDADSGRQQSGRPQSGELTADQLGSPAGQKLVALLQ